MRPNQWLLAMMFDLSKNNAKGIYLPTVLPTITFIFYFRSLSIVCVVPINGLFSSLSVCVLLHTVHQTPAVHSALVTLHPQPLILVSTTDIIQALHCQQFSDNLSDRRASD